MKVVIQRVSEASVVINRKLFSHIGEGMLIFVGIQADDNDDDLSWLASKIVHLRIFDDENGVMNRSILETGGDILAVSQFTLMARTKKGNRPSYIDAAPPALSTPLYLAFTQALQSELGKEVKTGEFGAMMSISLINEGPVTILIDSKHRN